MVDHIEFPVPPGTQIATDKIGSVDHPYGKIEDGTTGGTQPLAVTDHGGIGTETPYVSASGGVELGETSYADKACMGGAFLVATTGAGLYTIESLAVLLTIADGSAIAADTLPGFTIGFIGVPTGTDIPAAIPDGADMTSLDLSLVTTLQVLDPSLFFPHPIFPDNIAVATPAVPVGLGGAGGIRYSEASDLFAVIVADGAVATDLTADALIVSLGLTFRGDTSRPG